MSEPIHSMKFSDEFKSKVMDDIRQSFDDLPQKPESVDITPGQLGLGFLYVVTGVLGLLHGSVTR